MYLVLEPAERRKAFYVYKRILCFNLKSYMSLVKVLNAKNFRLPHGGQSQKQKWIQNPYFFSTFSIFFACGASSFSETFKSNASVTKYHLYPLFLLISLDSQIPLSPHGGGVSRSLVNASVSKKSGK